MNDYIVIPGNILRNPDLTYLQKLILAKITNLDNDKGCFATNKYFATLLSTSINSVSKTINQLLKLGLIKVEITDNTNRSITLAKKCRGDVVKVEGGSPKSGGSSVTINIDTNIDYKTIQSITPDVVLEIQKKYPKVNASEIYEDLVLYCESTGTKYKNYKATLQMWCSRATKKVKESKPYIQESKSRDDILRQRKEFDKAHNQFRDEDCAEPEEIREIFSKLKWRRKDVSDA